MDFVLIFEVILKTGFWPDFHTNTIDYRFWPKFYPNTTDNGLWPNILSNAMQYEFFSLFSS